jgi:hypothetical protein
VAWSVVEDGETGTRCTGAGSLRASTAGITGEERQDRSIESIVGDTVFTVVGCVDERSSVSTSGDADFVFRRRGDMRRLFVSIVVSFELLRLFIREEAEDEEREEEFEDIEVRGGRVPTEAALRRELVGAVGCGLDCFVRGGDERVKSSSSTSFCDGRSPIGNGIGAVSIANSWSRSLVGVADARHESNVVCFVFPGDIGTELPRDGFVAWAFFVRFRGSCDGEGGTGELSKSSVSTISNNGGVFGRSRLVHMSVGRV